MRKTDEFQIGRVSCYFFYFLLSILTILFAISNSISFSSMSLRLLAFTFSILSVVALPLLRFLVHIDNDLYCKIQIFCFAVMAINMGHLTGNAFSTVIVFFVLTICLIPFNSPAYFLYTIYLILAGVCLEGLLSIWGLSFPELNFHQIYSLVALLFCQIICMMIARINVTRNRHILEQERSLDDMLKVVETKCHDARTATRSKTNFLANMSHEIRTPINSILGMNELVLRESDEPDIKQYASNIEVAGEMLLTLINEILDFSKIESGRMELLMEEYDITRTIVDLVSLIAPRVESKGLSLRLEIDESLPSLLRGDDVRLRQVLSNILTNAVKFTKAGTITFRVSGRRVSDRIFLHFEVEDTGSGIKEEDIPKIFQAFQRVNEKENRSIEGSGLGMNITNQLLELMGSKLGIKSRVGHGTNFFFTINQEIVDDTPIGKMEGKYHRHELESREQSILYAPKAKVLVVDDNDMNRKVFMQLLKRTGMQIYEATGGEESVEMASQQPFDLIFMDHMMPGMDGIEALHAIRESDNFCTNIPIIVLTANAVSGAKEMYMREGFTDFLTKPIMPDLLEHALVEYLPQDLLESVPDPKKKKSVEKTPENQMKDAIAQLPAVDGLDWNFAEIHFNDPEILMTSLENFYLMIQKEADALDGFYQMLTFDDNMKQYRVKVHSMKSSAVLIGIFTLGGMAKTLENAAAAEDADTIYAMHEVFLREWLAYKERLSVLFPQESAESEEDKMPYDADAVLDMLDALNDAAAVLDTDMIDAIIGDLTAMSYPFDVAGEFESLRAAAVELDIESIAGVAKKLQAKVEG